MYMYIYIHPNPILGLPESLDLMIEIIPPEQSSRRSSVQFPGEQKWAPPG